MARSKPGWSSGLDRPIYAETGSDSAFWFSPDAEALFAAEGILRASPFGLLKTVVGGDGMERYRHKYRLAAEIYAAFADGAALPSIFECLQGFDLRCFTLASFREHCISFGDGELPGMLLDKPGCCMEELAGGEQGMFNSYLGASAYFSHTREFVESIFSLAGELRTDAFFYTLDRYRAKIEGAKENTIEALSAMAPLEFSDALMRKKMWRRGPYSFYAFAPTVFSDRRAVRYFKTEQYVFFAVQDAVYDNEHMLKQLKALADDTRFRIVALLKERGGLQGSDIAHIMGISASTVSHHMKVLREAGLMHEEMDGATKFYSLPTNITQAVTGALAEFLP